MKCWIIYRFEPNGDKPHIHVCGVVLNEEDRKKAVQQAQPPHELIWSEPANLLSWK